ncbi:DNA-binding transcriptional regulator, LysR family [Bacillus sp. OV322]|uniref:LysR family transcriptional regulator n=1 Tax=Bacillus sp. OV322 TaxID=1882764 RepID=UPI0008E71369|nr:LysR family transcriptional regulator [Bacillus sp. OV322]SFC52033.1 DNA-binding transcriptional regulator, LysR family [Bacillus sp. OV322]
MDIDGLESFLTVANKKSISKAAASLHITQPTLSTRIRKLEESLGFTLLERSWEGVTLSKQGDYFLPYAIQLLRELSNASAVFTNFSDLIGYDAHLKETSNLPQQRIRIGMNIWLAPVFTDSIIADLSNHFPQLDYQFFTKPTDTLKDMLEYNGIHLAIFYQNERKTGHYSRPLFEDEMVLICPDEDWALMEKDIHHLGRVDKPFLLLDNPVLANNKKLINSIRSKLDIKKCQIVDNINVMCSLISSKKGYTILPKTALFQIANLSSLPLKIVPLERKVPNIAIHIEYNESSPYAEPIRLIENKLTAYFERVSAS